MRHHPVRRRRTPVWSLLSVWGCTLALTLLSCTGVTLYSGVLHAALGDRKPGLREGWTSYGRQVLNDVGAGFVNALTVRAVPAESAIPTVVLLGDGAALEGLNRDIVRWNLGDVPRRATAPGYLVEPDGSLMRADISRRGANQWHQMAWKPSLRVRLAGGRLSGGFRDQVLVAPEDPSALRNWLSSELARRLGLVTPEEEPVRVFLNGAYKGVYARQRRLDESLLIHQSRPPGPFVRLDSGVGRVFRRETRPFLDPAAWDIQGGEDPETVRQQLKLLLELCPDPPSEEQQFRMGQLMDREAMADYMVVMAHSGTVHVEHHNVAFWLDPVSGQWAPVPLDFNGFGMRPAPDHLLPIVLYRNLIMTTWAQDPRNLALFAERLDSFLRGIGGPAAVETLVRETWTRVRPQAMADLHVSDMGYRCNVGARCLFPLPGLDADVDRIVAFARLRDAEMRRQLYGDRVQVFGVAPDGFSLYLKGYAGVRVRRVDGVRFPLLDTQRPPAEEFVLLPSLELPPPSVFAQGVEQLLRLGLEGSAVHRLPGRPEDYVFRHRLTDEVIAPGPMQGAPPDPARLGFPADRIQPPVMDELVLGPGEVVLHSRHVFAEGRRIRILPGTTLRLQEGAALVARGPLVMEGTANAPIRVEPSGDGRFGVIGIVGARTVGSRISHVELQGGSSSRILNLSLTGMLSVHDCPGLALDHVRLANAPVLLTVARSSVEVRDCTFTGGDVRQLLGTLTFEGAAFSGVALDVGMAQMRLSGGDATGLRSVEARGASHVLLAPGGRGGAAPLPVQAVENSIVHVAPGLACRKGEGAGNWRWGGAGRVTEGTADCRLGHAPPVW